MDDARLADLFEAEFDRMVALARALSHDAADVEDVVMDAFLETARRLDTIANPGGYLQVAVVHGARRRYRNSENRKRIRKAHSRSLQSAESEWMNEHYVDDLLESLSEQQHTALVLVYYLRMTYREAGDLMDCPTGTVKSLVHRALGQLRMQIAP